MGEQESVVAVRVEDELPVHPAANLFPLLEGDAFKELVADIREHGLREPVVLARDGCILDGRNRYRACLAANVAAVFSTWEGPGSAIDFVVSKNLHRRHLDESQRAMVAAKIANLADGQRADQAGASIDAPAITQSAAAEILNVSRPSVQRARRVREKGAPEVVMAVERGEMSVSRAATLIELPHAEQVKAIKTKPGSGRSPASKAKKRKLAPGEDSPAMTSMKSAWLAFIERYRAGTVTEQQRVIRWAKECRKWPRALDATDVERFDECQAGVTLGAEAAGRA
jgi:ParB-like chromosome segregation protein Spo0J